MNKEYALVFLIPLMGEISKQQLWEDFLKILRRHAMSVGLNLYYSSEHYWPQNIALINYHIV